MRFLILFLLSSPALLAQNWVSLPALPEAVTNNAVTQAKVGDSTFIYSFAGLDKTKIWSGIHLKSWRLRLGDTAWQVLPPVPDPAGGKIAAAASTVRGKIYLIGGYHVAANGNETSSPKVHCFDPAANAWLSDGSNIPIAIDDHVQAVWRDSLIFVVTGWSNTTNVPNVQIYNPSTDTWAAGTSVPNTSNYKVFGGSGTIVGDTIFYAGGARAGTNFPATAFFRKGYIHPDDPTQIDWLGTAEPAAQGYRMASLEILGKAVWLAGSDVTYNYNGIAYNGSGGVPALDRITVYTPNTGSFSVLTGFIPPTMDLRGAAKIGASSVVVAGGMGPGQQVSDQVWLADLNQIVPAVEALPELEVLIYPNPASDHFIVQSSEFVRADLFDIYGKRCASASGLGAMHFPVRHLPVGVYFLKISGENNSTAVKKIFVGP